MNVYIPIATGQDVHFMIKNSITAQTIHPDIVICDSPGEINSQDNYSPERIIGEVISRNLCIEAFLKTTDAYFLHQCRDVLQLRVHNYENLIAELEKDVKNGVAALASVDNVDVLTVACLAIKREVLEKGFRFENKYGKCLCKETFEVISAMGYNVKCVISQYIDNFLRK